MASDFSHATDIASTATGTWHVAARLEGRWVYELEADTQVRAASTIKLAVLLAAVQSVESGGVRWHTEVHLPAVAVGESGVLADLPRVRTLPLHELLTLMVTVSDNDATNAVLSSVVGQAAVNAAATRAGTVNTVLGRHMMDAEAAAAGHDNLTCARDQVALVEALTQASPGLLSADSIRQTRAMLARQQINDRIPALLPAGTPVLHKSGDLAGIYHDTGIVVLPDGRELALSVLGTDLSPDAAHTPGDTIARISRALYSAVTE